MSLGSATHESLLAVVSSSSQGPKHTIDISHAENGESFSVEIYYNEIFIKNDYDMNFEMSDYIQKYIRQMP